MYHPRYELLDLQGETTYSTGVSWRIEHRDLRNRVLIFTPFNKLTENQIDSLKLLHGVIIDRDIEISEDGIITIPISLDEKFGWILGKAASFYRAAQNNQKVRARALSGRLQE